MKLRHLYISLVTIVISLLPLSNVCAQDTQTNWTYMGKIAAVCSTGQTHQIELPVNSLSK